MCADMLNRKCIYTNNIHIHISQLILTHEKTYIFARKKSTIGLSHLEYIIVEKYHDDAGYVEAGQARVDDKIRIIEQTLVWYPIGSVIQA